MQSVGGYTNPYTSIQASLYTSTSTATEDPGASYGAATQPAAVTGSTPEAGASSGSSTDVGTTFQQLEFSLQSFMIQMQAAIGGDPSATAQTDPSAGTAPAGTSPAGTSAASTSSASTSDGSTATADTASTAGLTGATPPVGHHRHGVKHHEATSSTSDPTSTTASDQSDVDTLLSDLLQALQGSSAGTGTQSASGTSAVSDTATASQSAAATTGSGQFSAEGLAAAIQKAIQSYMSTAQNTAAAGIAGSSAAVAT